MVDPMPARSAPARMATTSRLRGEHARPRDHERPGSFDVRAFARSDDGIRRDIVEEVLPSLYLSPGDVRVSVENGDVVLEGEVERELDARCLPHAVGAVVGVIDVRSEVTARHEHSPA
jgi:osmotically-inducible protein OsmY